VRAEGSKIFIVFNPRLHTDFVYKNFVVSPPENCNVRKINYDENPYLSNTMRKVIEDAKNDDDFDHVYLGEPRTTDDEAIIQRKHIMAAIDAHIKLGITPAGTAKIGYDVADAGEDSCATISFKGSLATDCELWKAKEDELLKSCARVHAKARLEEALIVYDAIGVGASCGAKFNEMNQQSTLKPVIHQKFFAGGAPAKPDKRYKQTGISNRDFFSNIKAQAWWITADRFMNTYNAVTNGQEFAESDMIFIDSNLPHLDKLIDELVTPKRDYDLAGRVKVESKKDLAKRDIKSPNCADAFVLVAGNMEAAPMQINPNILR
jgi:phage terminase large subunit